MEKNVDLVKSTVGDEVHQQSEKTKCLICHESF